MPSLECFLWAGAVLIAVGAVIGVMFLWAKICANTFASERTGFIAYISPFVVAMWILIAFLLCSS